MNKRCPTCKQNLLQQIPGSNAIRCVNVNCPDYLVIKPYGEFIDLDYSQMVSNNSGYGYPLSMGNYDMPIPKSAKERLEQLKQLGVIANRLDNLKMHKEADVIDKLIVRAKKKI